MLLPLLVNDVTRSSLTQDSRNNHEISSCTNKRREIKINLINGEEGWVGNLI